MVDFAGWEMPLQYSGIINEHLWTRESASIFDVSHMGRVKVMGPDAFSFLNYLTTADTGRMEVMDARYALMLNERGGIIDDLVIYRLVDGDFLVVINAATTEKDLSHMERVRQEGKFDVVLENITEGVAQIALQGPESVDILQRYTDAPLDRVYYYTAVETKVMGYDVLLSRTGYTGEDGFEIYAVEDAIVNITVELLSNEAVRMAGLGARDTLRLEAGYVLYGNDIDESTDPISARLKWTIDFDKDFIGKEAVLRIMQEKPEYYRAGLRAVSRGIPRRGDPVEMDGGTVGNVTSGTFSPVLKKGIAMAYVKREHSKRGTLLRVKNMDYEVVKMPFVEGSVKKAPRKK